jgi:hypothetical protein
VPEIAVATLLPGRRSCGRKKVLEGAPAGRGERLLQTDVPLLFAPEVNEAVARDPKEPGQKPILPMLIGGKAFDGTHPYVLEQILGFPGIPYHVVNDTEEGAPGRIHDASKRFQVTASVVVDPSFKLRVLHDMAVGFGLVNGTEEEILPESCKKVRESRRGAIEVTLNKLLR